MQSAAGGVTHSPVHVESQVEDSFWLEQYRGHQTLSTNVQLPQVLESTEGYADCECNATVEVSVVVYSLGPV